MPLLDKVWMNKLVPVLSTAYFPPIAWFRAVAAAEVVYLERCENYQKQSWRNRARIATADGPLVLSLPICKSEGGPLPIARAEIELSKPWLQQHERALVAAYRSSPFFEYYIDEWMQVLHEGLPNLFETNLRLIRHLLELLGLNPEIRFTDEYRTEYPAEEGWLDLRESLHPKRPVPERWATKKPYYQVFSERQGFLTELSILDLLCNEGPDAISYLLY